MLEPMPRLPDKETFKLPVHRLTLDLVSENGPISFHLTFQNTEPPWEIQSDGEIGPWNEDDPGTHTVSGS